MGGNLRHISEILPKVIEDMQQNMSKRHEVKREMGQSEKNDLAYLKGYKSHSTAIKSKIYKNKLVLAELAKELRGEQ